MKLWGGRFTKQTNDKVIDYTASIKFDYALAEYDIQGSLAHVMMLRKCQILSETEAEQISNGLKLLQQKLADGQLYFELADEDIHMNIEKLLQQAIGDVAGKLHTGRSRNDQVALDLHLYVRHQIILVLERLLNLSEVILTKAHASIDIFMPGYTHLQRAEPIRFAHHMLAYFNMLQRDSERLINSWHHVNTSPLGAGALAGSGVLIDREYVAQILKFDTLYENSLDAVSDRDFIVEFHSNAALMMMHLSKLSEEIILWCSQEFNFIELDDAYCTGSSMMPQKKNPDIAELARAKTGRVYGALLSILTVLKGLPLAYNKDLQEDKESLFDTVNTVKKTLEIYADMLVNMRVKQAVTLQAASNDYANATQVTNYLVNKNIPFRKAHEITGKLVLYCIERQLFLKDLDLVSYQKFCSAIEADIYSFISIEAVVEAHQSRGGTAKNSIIFQLEQASFALEQTKKWLQEHIECTRIQL